MLARFRAFLAYCDVFLFVQFIVGRRSYGLLFSYGLVHAHIQGQVCRLRSFSCVLSQCYTIALLRFSLLFNSHRRVCALLSYRVLNKGLGVSYPK